MPKAPDVKIAKINVDEAPELAAEFGILSIPALFCFVDGKKRAEFIGVTDVSDLLAALQ